MRKISYYLLIALLHISLLSCATGNSANQLPPGYHSNGSEHAAEVSEEEYTIRTGDVLEIKFFETSELDQVVTVRPDGRISLPLAEDILVVGMTPSALDTIITKRYSERIKEPEVTVVLKNFAGQKVFVAGEVENPGLVELTDNMTVLQSIFSAGGFKRSAQLDSVMVVRNNRDQPSLFRVDVEKVLDDEGNEFLLKSYDVVYVPKTFITKANDFVDQYLNRIIPESVRTGFNFIYHWNDSGRGNDSSYKIISP